MSPTPGKAKRGKKAAKTGEALRKQAIAETEQRIAAIDVAERGAPPAEPAAAADSKPDAKPKQAKAGKTPKPAKAPREAKPKRMGVLDAAAAVLKEAGKPLTAVEIMQLILQKKLWSSQGKTPHQTLFAGAIREIKAKGDQARFTKPEPGKFAFNAAKKEA